MTGATSFCTFGYGRWSADVRTRRMLAALRLAGVGTLVDIRHSPCPSQDDVKSHYGPREWHLLAGGQGLPRVLADAGIRYRWVVELGNPQKRDPSMTILREHLADAPGGWPVHRGLRVVAAHISGGESVAVMCACPKLTDCHRRLIAEALLPLLPTGTRHTDLTG